MIRITEKELAWGVDSMCNGCEYGYVPYSGFCADCRENVQIGVFCPKCTTTKPKVVNGVKSRQIPETFNGVQPKEFICQKCKAVFPNIQELLDEKEDKYRIAFHLA